MLQSLRRMNIQYRVFACIILFSLMPQMLMVTLLYRSNLERLVETTQSSIYRQIVVSNAWMDEQLNLLTEASQNILIDDFLYSVYAGEETALTGYVDNEPSEKTIERSVRKTLSKYFASNSIVAHAEINTQTDGIAMYNQHTDYQRFWDSDLHRAVEAQQGGILWLGREEMAPYEVEGNYLSCMRLLNLRRVAVSGVGYFLPQDRERPVLRVLLSDEFIASQLARTIEGAPGAQYILMAQDGTVLLSGGEPYGELDADTLRLIQERPGGILGMNTREGRRMVVCFDTLQETGWKSLAILSVDALAAPLIREIRGMYVAIIVLSIVTLLFTALLATGIMRKRIGMIAHAINEVRRGNFAAQIAQAHRDEFTGLIDDFNAMSTRLRQLVDENLQISMQEQEAQMQTLMTQLNPHYIYNSLNVINWFALRENARQTSALVVALSRMLRYTSNNQERTARLRDDIRWMQDYVKLMEARFAGLFTVQWEIGEENMELELPKLIMQPLVENSILHGFAGRKSGGVIVIRVWREGDDVYCEVQDNGCGMDVAKAREMLAAKSEHVGLYNVQKRVVMRYGEAYGLTIHSQPGVGTRVTVHMSTSKGKPIAH